MFPATMVTFPNEPRRVLVSAATCSLISMPMMALVKPRLSQ